MDKILFEQLPELFESVAAVFADKRDELCDMDAKMGDGDLGLTMDKGYGALPDLIRENAEPGDIGKTLMKAGRYPEARQMCAGRSDHSGCSGCCC